YLSPLGVLFPGAAVGPDVRGVSLASRRTRRANRLNGGGVVPSLRGPKNSSKSLKGDRLKGGHRLPFGAQVVPTALPLFPFCILADSSSKSPQWRWRCSFPSGPKKLEQIPQRRSPQGRAPPAIRGPSRPYRTPAFSVLYSGGLVEQIASMEVVLFLSSLRGPRNSSKSLKGDRLKGGHRLTFGAQVVPTALPPLFPFCILADSSSKSPQWRWCCSLAPFGAQETRANPSKEIASREGTACHSGPKLSLPHSRFFRFVFWRTRRANRLNGGGVVP
ncbi:hypothetical protein L9F63_008194, partial [Diploptera punctata]